MGIDGRAVLTTRRASTGGFGVFTRDPIRAGSLILEYGGAVVRGDELPSPYPADGDRYLQIGPDLYRGPSGGFDDYVNHSCDPNCWLRINGDRVVQIALRDIAAGEELTFDYSTTMLDDGWTMPCACGSPSCRGTVAEFAKLPAEVRKRYRDLRIVPAYVQAATEPRPRKTEITKTRKSENTEGEIRSLPWERGNPAGGSRRIRRIGR